LNKIEHLAKVSFAMVFFKHILDLRTAILYDRNAGQDDSQRIGHEKKEKGENPLPCFIAGTDSTGERRSSQGDTRSL